MSEPMRGATCAVCGRPWEAQALRCECGVLALDHVRALPDEDAESLLESNAAATRTDLARGRRMMWQGALASAPPLLVTVVGAAFAEPTFWLVGGACALGCAGWGLVGRRRLVTARRVAAANRIALPAATLRRP